jgi:hypothetical protein
LQKVEHDSLLGRPRQDELRAAMEQRQLGQQRYAMMDDRRRIDGLRQGLRQVRLHDNIGQAGKKILHRRTDVGREDVGARTAQSGHGKDGGFEAWSGGIEKNREATVIGVAERTRQSG